MSPHLKMVLYGIAAGLLSAILWAGFSYATGRELGWIAWGVGLLVGVAIRLAADDVGGWGPGIMAVAIALVSILCGKYLAVRFVVAGEFAGVQEVLKDFDPEFAKVELGIEVAAEYEAQKKKLDWPKKTRLLTAETRGPQTASEFPAVVWKETNRRWEKLTPDEQGRRIAVAKKNVEQRIDTMRRKALVRGFDLSFSVFDILWFLLAAATAFRIGSGVASED
jgi:hypothetical protein